MTDDHSDAPTFHELDRVADDAPGREELLATVRARHHRSVTRRRYYALGSVAAAVLLLTGTAAALSPAHTATPVQQQSVAAVPDPTPSTSTRSSTATTASTPTTGSTATTAPTSQTIQPTLAPSSSTGSTSGPQTTTATTREPAPVGSSDLGKQVALPGVAVVDAINLISPGRTTSDLRADVEYVFAAGPNGTDGKDAEVAVFAPSAGFTADRVKGHRPETLDGHAAWFGPVSTWPTNGRVDPESGKQDAANSSLTWQLPNGWWLVLQSSAASPTDPNSLLRLADTLHITSRTTPSRVPFRFSHVPEGFATDNTAANWFEAGRSPLLLQSGLTIARGTAQISVTVSRPAVAPSDPGSTDEVLRQRTVRGYVVSAAGTGGVSATEVQEVLDGIQVADDPSRENDGWPTIGQVKAAS